VLDRLESVADRLPQVVQLGNQDGDGDVDFLQIARRMIGTDGDPLYSEDDMEALRGRLGEIQSRIDERQGEIEALSTARTGSGEDESTDTAPAEDDEDRVAEIRRSVTDEAVKERVERIGDGDGPSGDVSESGGTGER
jgi:hypothetical protein